MSFLPLVEQVPEEALDSLTFGLKTSVRQSNAAVLSAALTVLPLHLEAIAQSADIQVRLSPPSAGLPPPQTSPLTMGAC
jgi:hypothetical protein